VPEPEPIDPMPEPTPEPMPDPWPIPEPIDGGYKITSGRYAYVSSLVDSYISIIDTQTRQIVGNINLPLPGQNRDIALSDGYLYVLNESGSLREIEEEILKARARAEKILSEKQVDEGKFTEAAAMLERELARLKVVRKRGHSRLGPRIKSE